MREVFVGCGSNIEPERHLLWALGALERRFGPIRRSSVYRSAAFGFDGPDFLNMVIGFSTDEPVDVVEGFLSELESECGRAVDSRSGSRTLDLDLLLFGQRVDPKWRLPRDDVLRYSFVRIPLAELEPGLRHPVTGIVMQDAGGLTTLDDANLTAIGALDAA